MLDVLITLFSLRLSWIDIKSHKIHNSDLFIYAIPLGVYAHRISVLQTAIAIFSALAASLLFKIGGGDLKLFSLLAITQGSLVLTQSYCANFLIAIFISLAVVVIRNRRWGVSVPLAPAILAPFLLAYLDI